MVEKGAEGLSAINLVCAIDNDLYRVLLAAGYPCRRYASLEAALRSCERASALLVLSDDYPQASLHITAAHLERAAAKKLRLYVEYPQSLAGLRIGAPQPTMWERVVVSSGWFAPDLPEGTILALHGCWILPTEAAEAHLVAAKVAGYRELAYGLPPEVHPILFQLPGHDLLVTTSKLSGFVTGRYGPRPAWAALWERILAWLQPGCDLPALAWQPTVGVQAGPGQPLPPDAEAQAMHRSQRWFHEQVLFGLDRWKGAIEGFEAAIDHKGRQLRRGCIRADCIGETALVLACDWALGGNPVSRHLAGQVLDYVLTQRDFVQPDPQSPVYGLINWYERGPAFYGDDNARVILPGLAAGRLLDDSRWDEPLLRCLLANLRTTGRLGFRRPRLDWPASFPAGRGQRYYQDEDYVHYSPHYQAYLWAAFLWAYALTGYEEFLAKPRRALGMTMAVYPKLRWTNGLSQEMARLLLPLTYLLRVDNTAEHRDWLERVSTDLLRQMQPSGAIHELLGPLEDGQYPPPRSNETYGTTEASILQRNGDPACDLLYTTNYAFLGLHEAAQATGDRILREAEDRLARFLCRIQVRSTAHPYLDGAWMRSFDDQIWEYWGSSADAGWGAWSVEAGWTNTWIAAVLALRQRGEALWDLSIGPRLLSCWPRVLNETPDSGERE